MDSGSRKRARSEEPDWCDALTARSTFVLSEFVEINKQLQDRMQRVKEREDEMAEMEEKMAENVSAAKERIKLDVGGRIFSTTKSTLLKYGGTYFHALLSSGNFAADEGDAYFIDRDPQFFDRIMASLRTGKPVKMYDLSPTDAQALTIEIDYYMLHNIFPGSPVRWDISRRGRKVSVTDGGRTAHVKRLSGKHRSGITSVLGEGDHVPEFKVKINSRGASGNLLVGCVKSDAFSLCGNRDLYGLFLNVGDGRIYKHGDVVEPDGAWRGPISNGDVIAVSIDMVSRTVAFHVNGQIVLDPGLKLSSDRAAHHLQYLPCVDFFEPGASVSIMD